MTHSSQIIIGDDLSIRWSANGLISSFIELGVISNYSLSLQWQTKEVIPVGRTFEESVKMALKGTLNLTAMTDKSFEMPSEYVWLEIGLLIRELTNGDRWQWNRTGKYLITNDVRIQQPDGMVEHQYSLLIQNAISTELVLVPATRVVFWRESSTAALQVPSNFESINLVKIL